jgi:hypothetical protein
MNPTPKHTTTPWKITADRNHTGICTNPEDWNNTRIVSFDNPQDHFVYVEATFKTSGHSVLELTDKGKTQLEQNRANAAHIVKCVNLHDELVGALEGILEIGKRDMSNPKYDGYFNTAEEILTRAKAAK